LLKFRSANTIGAAVTSSVIAVLIRAQIAVYPAPKNPYTIANTIMRGNEVASIHIVKQAIVAIIVDKQARIFKGTFTL
jgi:hypothetical protein